MLGSRVSNTVKLFAVECLLLDFLIDTVPGTFDLLISPHLVASETKVSVQNISKPMSMYSIIINWVIDVS